MSAFIVSKNHIHALVNARLVADGTPPTNVKVSDLNELGQMLWDENHKSVEHRYGTTPSRPRSRPRYTFAVQLPLSPVAILKLIDCYEYQSCEHDGWATSKAQKFCHELRAALSHKLPGYDAAPWGIP